MSPLPCAKAFPSPLEFPTVGIFPPTQTQLSGHKGCYQRPAHIISLTGTAPRFKDRFIDKGSVSASHAWSQHHQTVMEVDQNLGQTMTCSTQDVSTLGRGGEQLGFHTPISTTQKVEPLIETTGTDSLHPPSDQPQN